MKKYNSYKETKEVYFSGEIIFPVTLVLIASFITYGLLYFFGVAIAVFFNLFISWCSYFYLYYYGKSNTGITFDFLKGVVLIVGILLFVDYGVYALTVYQKTGLFNEFYFQLWASILFGTPLLYYGFQYARYFYYKRKMAVNYLKVSLKIHHDRELLTYIDSIQFLNTSKSKISDIKLEKAPCFYSKEELEKMEDDSTRNYYLEK